MGFIDKMIGIGKKIKKNRIFLLIALIFASLLIYKNYINIYNIFQNLIFGKTHAKQKIKLPVKKFKPL
ncbi:hypothetical protein [Moraxella lacunata]|uniref:hypothetical protein n=1 Tax=Moraxella lacunata TaxID=477 RepID=UPI003EE0E98D